MFGQTPQVPRRKIHAMIQCLQKDFDAIPWQDEGHGLLGVEWVWASHPPKTLIRYHKILVLWEYTIPNQKKMNLKVKEE